MNVDQNLHVFTRTHVDEASLERQVVAPRTMAARSLPTLMLVVHTLANPLTWNVCDNTCASNGNAWCDDVEGGSCAFGTDCNDCGPRQYCCPTKLKVCKDTKLASDPLIVEQVALRLGAAAGNSTATISPRHSCVPITCENYEGCTGCEDMPACIPMSKMDKACSLDGCEHRFCFACIRDPSVARRIQHLPVVQDASADALSPQWRHRRNLGTCAGRCCGQSAARISGLNGGVAGRR